MSAAACVLLLPGPVCKVQLLPLLQEAQGQHCSRVYVCFAGSSVPAVSASLLHWLAADLYAAVGQLDPRWDVLPCLQCAGWTQERLQSLPDVQLLVAPSSLQQQAQALQQSLNSSSGGGSHGRGRDIQLCVLQQQQPLQQVEQDQPQEQDQLQFASVAVGGTFDRLHAGHRLLLAATALVATRNIYAGITADTLLAKKANRHLLQSYEARRAAAVDFMALVHPGLAAIAAGALSDPQEPTQAELDPSMQALVVSAETLAGGQAINAGRQARGFAPVQLVVVGLVGGSGDAASKLSSTALRQADATGGGG